MQFLSLATAFSSVLSLTLADLKQPQSVLSFHGVYGSNFNETLVFCSPPPHTWELNTWRIVTVLGRAADSGQNGVYNEKGAILDGGSYIAPNNTIVWRGLGFSANGPYDTAFALSKDGKTATGWYTFYAEKADKTPGGETGPWNLFFKRAPTVAECAQVLAFRGVGT